MARSKAKAQQTSLSVRVAVDVSEDTPAYYVNYAEVAHSQHEFGLLIARTPVKPSPQTFEDARQTGELRIPAELHIILPPTMIPGLIRALNVQQQRYEQEFGVIVTEQKKEAAK